MVCPACYNLSTKSGVGPDNRRRQTTEGVSSVIDTSIALIALDRALEAHGIHAATCKPRKQALPCSVCDELCDRLIAALRASMAQPPEAA